MRKQRKKTKCHRGRLVDRKDRLCRVVHLKSALLDLLFAPADYFTGSPLPFELQQLDARHNSKQLTGHGIDNNLPMCRYRQRICINARFQNGTSGEYATTTDFALPKHRRKRDTARIDSDNFPKAITARVEIALRLMMHGDPQQHI